MAATQDRSGAPLLLPTALLMLKAPVAGQVKTRLAREIGEALATLAYRQLVEHQLAQIPSEWKTHVCYSPAAAEADMRTWLGRGPTYSAQTNGDLGERLAAATRSHFQQSSSPLVLLGGDCPYLTSARLLEAEAALLEAPVVIVPAADGGYCLLALRAPVGQVFRDIHWSTGAVLEETRARLQAGGTKWRELAVAEDVDDLPSWGRAVQCFPALAPFVP